LKFRFRGLVSVVVAAVMSISLLTPVGQTVQADSGDFELRVLHLNDTHAHLDNVARRVTAIKEARAEVENSILLDAGDVFSGTLFFNQYEGLADLQFMNMIGYDAMVPGNHEFDKGPEVFAEFIKQAEFPIVSANIDYSNEPALNSLFKDEIGSPAEDGTIYPAIILEVGGEKIGVFGLTTPETAFLANPGENVVFENEIEKAKEAVEQLEQRGINKIIALTHLGYTYDVELAKQVEGIDIIVGGHSHTQLDEPVVFNEDTEPTIVVQAKEYSEYLGKLDVVFNKDGVLTSWNEELVHIDAKDENGQYLIPSDEEAQKLYEELLGPIEELKAEIVGTSDVFLNGERTFVRRGETNLGNLITDGMLAAAKKAIPETTLALQNGGGIRASIDKGEISLGEVLTTMPFGNTLVTLELSGAEVIEALENGVSKIEEVAGRFPQVSGMKFTFDATKPAGERIVEVFVKTENGYEPIDKDNMYVLATNAYIANGGDDYQVFKKAKDEGRMTELFVPDYEVFNAYLEEIGTVKATFEGRILQSIHDMKSTDFGFEAAQEIVARNIVPLEDGKFYPQAKVTRAEAAAWLTNALMLKAPENVNVFADVDESHPYAEAIAAVKDAGIFNGYADGTFRPDQVLTREQMATILVRAFKLQKKDMPVKLSDLGHVSASHKANVEILFQNGITKGSNGKFNPHKQTTRVQFAVFLQRALNK
jgi:2',3'-cyclic-nucleotide 2'-phosphodiesterase (5'-nucleotidase family)